MVGSLIRALLYLCVLALAFYLVIWCLAELGIVLPVMVIHIIGVMFVLIAILVLWQLFSPWIGGVDWWGRGPRP
jgi:hypothetical protein